MFCYPTAVSKLVYTGTIDTNASGCCFLAAAPQRFNSGLLIYSIDPLFKSPAYDSLTGQTSACMMSDRSITAANAQKCRVVAASLKAKYVGPVLNTSGFVIGALMPGALPINMKPNDLMEEFYKNKFAMGTDAEVIWVPREDIDMDFKILTDDNNTTLMVLAFYGAPPSVAGGVDYTLTVHVEYVPSNTNYISTVDTVESDIRSNEVIQSVVNHNPGYVVSKASDDSVSQKIRENLRRDIASREDRTTQLVDSASNVVREWMFGTPTTKGLMQAAGDIAIGNIPFNNFSNAVGGLVKMYA
jgi:hypothetical protein